MGVTRRETLCGVVAVGAGVAVIGGAPAAAAAAADRRLAGGQMDACYTLAAWLPLVGRTLPSLKHTEPAMTVLDVREFGGRRTLRPVDGRGDVFRVTLRAERPLVGDAVLLAHPDSPVWLFVTPLGRPRNYLATVNRWLPVAENL